MVYNTTEKLIPYRCSECHSSSFYIKIKKDGKTMITTCMSCFHPYEFEING